MTKVRLKKAVEPPAQVREIVDKVINTPFDALPDVLDGFSWRFEKGDFNHWATLFNYFDDLLERALVVRQDLQLKYDSGGGDIPFPSRSVLAILRVSAIILENCSNKHLYHSYEHLTSLLAAPDPAVVIATLHTLVAFVRKTHASSVRWHGWPDLNTRLLALSQGWGGKEEGLDLTVCTQSDEGPIRPCLSLGTTLNFQFYADASDAGKAPADSSEPSGLRVINLQHLDRYQESEHDILRQLVQRFAVPEKLRFSLLGRITVARKFGTLEGRRHLARLRLLSLHILFQCNPSPEAVAEFYSQEPEFVSDLVCLLVGGAAIPEDLRILALRVLAVQLLDRTHHTGVITAISSGGQSGLLSMLMHRSIASVAAGAAGGAQPEYSVQFVDALLTLVGALSASTSGCSALQEAGTLSALMPMLKDTDPAHIGLVASAVRILEAFMDFSTSSASQFREMGGLTDMIDRLKLEVGITAEPDQAVTPAAAARPDDMQTDAPAPRAVAAPAGPKSGAAAPQPGVLISYQRRVLLKALLRTIALTSYAPGASARPQEEDSAALYACLRRIFERSSEFGGGLFALSASVMTDQMHHEPLTFTALEEAGLPEAFLNTIKAGVLPSGEAVCAVPSTLVALCLNEKGLERVKESKALDCFVPIFTTPTYLRALQFQGDTPSALGSNFDELMRHVNSLRNDTVEMVLTIFRKLCEIGGQADNSPEETGTSTSAQPMDTDDAKPADVTPADVDMSGSAAASSKAGSDRHANWHPHVAECIMHSARLLETMLANQSFSRQFVEKGGLQLLLRLYTLKHLPPTFGSSSAAHAVMAAFRACTQLHGALVTEKVAEALAEHLRTTLLLAMSIGRSALQDVDAKRRDEYTRCVSSLEGVTSLASAVSRSGMSMLNEVSKAGRFAGLKTLVLDEPVPELALAVENVTPASAIIARVGDLERIVHLQIALAENRKAEMDAEGLLEAASAEGVQKAAPQEPAPEAEAASAVQNFAELVDGLSMRQQQRVLREAAMRANQGLPMPSRALLLAAESERLAEDGDVVEPPAAGSPREASGGHKNGKKKSGEDLALEVLTHFAATVRGFYSSLTKSIHTPLRRREEGLAMTPAIRSTALHLGLVMKMNCEGVGIKHWDGSGPDPSKDAEASSSSAGSLPPAKYKEWSQWRARYLSAMVDDLGVVLFDNRRGTCHCLMLNYWVRCGGLQAFLAQFGTAAQFLWDVTAAEAALGSAPASQMEEAPSSSEDARRKTEAERKRVGRVKERAEMLLASMLALLNQLSDSARILNSPLAASLLVVPLNDEDQETNAAWSSAENLVKSLKSAILDAVLPVWGSPSLASCSPQNTGAVTSILKHCTEAVTPPASRSGARGAPPPDPAIVQQVVEMGFSEERVREALRRVGHNSVELAMEWLISHPEELMEAAPPAPQPQADQVPVVAKAINLAPAQALLKPKNEAPSTEQLVDGAVSVLEQVPTAAFSLADLLKSHSAQQGCREDGAVIARLLQRLHSGDSFAETVSGQPAVGLLAPAHLLALLCDDDPGMRRAGAKTGLPSVVLGLLEAWVAAHATRPSALKGLGTGDVEPIPRWVDALLLVLDACTRIDWQAPEAPASAPELNSVNEPAAPEAEQGMDVDAPGAPEQPAATTSAPAAEEAQALEQPSAPGPADTTAMPEPAPSVEDVFRKLPKHEGILSEEEEDRAVRVAMALLRHLHAWGAVYQEPKETPTEAAALQLPDPPSSAQGVLLLLSCLTKRHSIALKVLAGRGPKLILELPLACFTPDLEPYISAIMRHILEDPVTLQAAMEAEIRSTLTKGRAPKPSGYPSVSQQSDGSMPVKQFLQTCAAVINREPTVFFDAVLGTCTIRENNGRPLVVLKKVKADGAKLSDDKKDGDAPSGGPPDSSTGGASRGSGASGPSAATPDPQGNPASSSGGVGGSAPGGSTPGPSGSGAPAHRRDGGSARRHGGAGGGTPGGGPPGGGPGGGGGGGGGGGKTPKDKDKEKEKEKDGKTPGRSGKKVPSNFVEVIDTLVDLVLRYEGPYSESKPKDPSTGAAAMDTDTPAAQPSSSEAPSADVTLSADLDVKQIAAQVEQAARAKSLEHRQQEKNMLVQCIALKMLTDFTLMYNACVGVLLKRDAEGTRGRGSSPPSTPAAPKLDSAQNLLFRHVMHRHLVFMPEPEVSMQPLGEQTSFFLQAVCIRSAEGRKRIISEIVRTLSPSPDQKPPAAGGMPSAEVLATIPFKQKDGFPPPYKVKAFVELAGSLLSAGAAKSQAGQPSGLSGEMLRCMRSAGVINALIGALKLIDMDHPNAVKSITSILKPLEILTRALPPSLLGAFSRQSRQPRLFDRTTLGGVLAAGPSEPDVERALAALEGPSSGDEPMRDAQEESAAAGPEAVAAAERLRQAFERDQNQDGVDGLSRSVESVMEQIIEHAYGEDGMEGFPESDSEGDGTDEDVIESEEDDAMGEEPMPDMTDEEDEDLEGAEGPDDEDDDDDDDDDHHRHHHRHHHHDSADQSVYSDDESSSDESGDEDHEVEVIFDDIEEDAMVGPLMGDDQLIMEHGGDEDGSTEDEDDMHDGGEEGDDHGHYEDGDEDDDVDDDEDEDGEDGEDFGIDDLPAMEDHDFLLEDDEDGLLAWPEEDGMMGDEMFHPNPHPPRWVGIPRMNGTHNLARAGAAAQQNAVEMMVNELLNTGALGGVQVDGRDQRFRYRMRATQQPNGAPSAAGLPGATGAPRHRLLQRPPAAPGARSAADEGRSANEMRIMRMNQPFPGLFGAEDAAGAGEYWMITADNGQRGFPGPRGIMLQAPNAGSLIDFSGDVLRTPGVMAGMSNWSNDGQPPSALESTQLAGQLEQSLVETLRQHAAPEEAEEHQAGAPPTAAAVDPLQEAQTAIAQALERAAGGEQVEAGQDMDRVLSTIQRHREELEQAHANMERNQQALRQMDERLRNAPPDLQALLNSSAQVRQAVNALQEASRAAAALVSPAAAPPAPPQAAAGNAARSTPQAVAAGVSGQTASEQQSNETMVSPQDANRAAANVATSLESLRQSIRSVDAVPEDLREAWERLILTYGEQGAARQGEQMPATAQALTDPQVDIIRQSLRDRVGGRLRENGSQAAAAQFERFVAGFDPRNIAQVPADMQAMINAIENSARPQPTPEGPRRYRGRVPPGRSLLPPSTPASTDAPAERPASAQRAQQTAAQPQPEGEQTPAATAPGALPPPAPRRTRYQARLRGTPPQDVAERDSSERLRTGLAAALARPPQRRPASQPAAQGQPPAALSTAIGAELFSSAMSAAMSGMTASAQPAPAQPPPSPPPIIGANMLSAALSGAAALSSSAAESQPQPGRDVEMANAVPPSEALAERSSPPASSGAISLPEDPAELARALEGTGIDLEVFLSMPPALQREVLGDAGYPTDAAAGSAAATPGAPSAERPQPMDTAQPSAEPGSSAGPAEGDVPAGASGPSAQDGSDDEMAGIDPEFLAALPEELQAEVLEAQRRERRQRRAEAEHAAAQAAAAAGQRGPQELDLATTLASFPPEVRDEVLMTADEEMLAQLPPAILAEAQALRERAHGRLGARHVAPRPTLPSELSDAALRGMRDHARRRGELARQRLASGAGRLAGYGDFSMDRIQATVDSRIQQSLFNLGKGPRPDLELLNPVKVDDEALVALISLLRVTSPLVKQHLQRLFLNLCEDRATMESALRILLSLLRAPLSTDEARAARQESEQPMQPSSLSAALQAGEGMAAAEEASELLPLVHLGILGRGATAVPPAMTRRILELVTHLAKHTAKAAFDLIRLDIRPAEAQAAILLGAQDKKGKGKAIEEQDVARDSKVGLDVLLELLGKTLCKRSAAHLEAALSTIEVTLSVAKRYDYLADTTTRQLVHDALERNQARRDAAAGLEAAPPTADSAGAAAGAAGQPATPGSTQQDPPPTPAAAARRLSSDAMAAVQRSAAIEEKMMRDASGKNPRKPLLEGVDQGLLRQLPRLLGQGGMSEAAYKRAAKCIRLVVICCEDSKTPMLNELESELHKLSGEAVRELSAMVAGKGPSSAVVNIGLGALGSRVLCICEVINALINPKGVKDQTPLVQLVGGQDLLFKDKEVDPQDIAGLEELISRTEPLWAALSDAIAALEADLPKLHPAGPADVANPNRILSPGATQVLPLVKAFFVLCEPRTSHLPPPLSMRRRSSTSVSMDLSLAPVTSEETPFQSASPDGKPLEAQLPFLRFAERHRRLVNVLIQQNVQLLLEGPLTQLMRTPRLIDFDNKRAFFRSQVRSASDRYHGSLRIHVRREHIFEDSFHQLRSKTPEEMRGKLSVQFHSEEGIDAGGVTREWYQVMARETFNPNISLFVPTGGSTFQPNPNSIVQNDEARGTNHLDFFKFVGRVVGKALYDGQLIDAYFTRSFYKHMLGQPLTYQDIEGVDPEYFKNLTWLLEHDMTDVVDLNFVEEVDYFGRVEHVELKPGGRDIKVTNENKREYVDLVAEHRMTTAIRAQIQAFLKGFWEMVPRDLISMFNDHELELLISGLPEIDVDDLRANTDYHGYSPASPVIQYFWEVVREMDKEDLALLVQFVTGTSKVPLEGFKALQGIGGPQKFQIHKAYGSQQKLPAAHTCFNQLDLVEYESKEQLRDRLMLALHEGATGFGFG